MIKLDDNFLQTLGLGALPAQDKGAMLKHIYDTLEMRVGMRLAEQMTDEQLAEFETYIDRNDNDGALKWLETNLPNYKDVVAEELEKLKAEVAASAGQILADAQARHAAAADQLAQAQQNLAAQPAQPAIQPQAAPVQPVQPVQPEPQPSTPVAPEMSPAPAPAPAPAPQPPTDPGSSLQG